MVVSYFGYTPICVGNSIDIPYHSSVIFVLSELRARSSYLWQQLHFVGEVRGDCKLDKIVANFTTEVILHQL